MNAKDFYDWKRHPVTQEVFSQLGSRVNGLKDELAMSAGVDSGLDRERVGAIKAYMDMLLAEYEGDEETQ